MSAFQYNPANATNFSPKLGAGQTISATTTSSSVTGLDTTKSELLLTNDGAVTVFVRWGVGAQTATSADMPMLANTSRIVFKDAADTVAAITASGTASVRVIPGFGQ